mmetsp:Transcript_10775/g.26395  ORF Transcript_10775/g.26395 Transcript_10775/m.26395 type:complete len:1095 (+) Transcript_10775:4248-7532(+)
MRLPELPRRGISSAAALVAGAGIKPADATTSASSKAASGGQFVQLRRLNTAAECSVHDLNGAAPGAAAGSSKQKQAAVGTGTRRHWSKQGTSNNVGSPGPATQMHDAAILNAGRSIGTSASNSSQAVGANINSKQVRFNVDEPQLSSFDFAASYAGGGGGAAAAVEKNNGRGRSFATVGTAPGDAGGADRDPRDEALALGRGGVIEKKKRAMQMSKTNRNLDDVLREDPAWDTSHSAASKYTILTSFSPASLSVDADETDGVNNSSSGDLDLAGNLVTTTSTLGSSTSGTSRGTGELQSTLKIPVPYIDSQAEMLPPISPLHVLGGPSIGRVKNVASPTTAALEGLDDFGRSSSSLQFLQDEQQERRERLPVLLNSHVDHEDRAHVDNVQDLLEDGEIVDADVEAVLEAEVEEGHEYRVGGLETGSQLDIDAGQQQANAQSVNMMRARKEAAQLFVQQHKLPDSVKIAKLGQLNTICELLCLEDGFPQHFEIYPFPDCLELKFFFKQTPQQKHASFDFEWSLLRMGLAAAGAGVQIEEGRGRATATSSNATSAVMIPKPSVQISVKGHRLFFRFLIVDDNFLTTLVEKDVYVPPDTPPAYRKVQLLIYGEAPGSGGGAGPAGVDHSSVQADQVASVPRAGARAGAAPATLRLPVPPHSQQASAAATTTTPSSRKRVLASPLRARESFTKSNFKNYVAHQQQQRTSGSGYGSPGMIATSNSSRIAPSTSSSTSPPQPPTMHQLSRYHAKIWINDKVVHRVNLKRGVVWLGNDLPSAGGAGPVTTCSCSKTSTSEPEETTAAAATASGSCQTYNEKQSSSSTTASVSKVKIKTKQQNNNRIAPTAAEVDSEVIEQEARTTRTASGGDEQEVDEQEDEETSGSIASRSVLEIGAADPRPETEKQPQAPTQQMPVLQLGDSREELPKWMLKDVQFRHFEVEMDETENRDLRVGGRRSVLNMFASGFTNQRFRLFKTLHDFGKSWKNKVKAAILAKPSVVVKGTAGAAPAGACAGSGGGGGGEQQVQMVMDSEKLEQFLNEEARKEFEAEFSSCSEEPRQSQQEKESVQTNKLKKRRKSVGRGGHNLDSHEKPAMCFLQ